MIPLIAVFIGAGIGGVLRYGVGLLALRWLGPEFPWGTFAVNVAGSLAMGALAAFFVPRIGQPGMTELRLFLTTGVLGGFTTFSAFSLDAIYLWQRGATTEAALYVGGSIVVSFIGLVLGLSLVRFAAG